MSNRVRYYFAALLALLMGFTLIGTATAEESRPLKGRRITRGIITSSDEVTLTVAGQAAVYKGLRLVAYGGASEDGESLQSYTTDFQLVRRQIRWRAGEIVHVDGNSFTLMTLRGRELQVEITPRTRFRLPGLTEPALDDFHIGDRVVVAGRPTSPGRMTALLVTIRPPNWSHGRPIFGIIHTIRNRELTLHTSNGRTITVVTNAETRYRIGRRTDARLADFATGDRVVVLVSPEPDGERLLATHLMKRDGG
jgi:hypothetical protein